MQLFFFWIDDRKVTHSFWVYFSQICYSRQGLAAKILKDKEDERRKKKDKKKRSRRRYGMHPHAKRQALAVLYYVPQIAIYDLTDIALLNIDQFKVGIIVGQWKQQEQQEQQQIFTQLSFRILAFPLQISFSLLFPFALAFILEIIVRIPVSFSLAFAFPLVLAIPVALGFG